MKKLLIIIFLLSNLHGYSQTLNRVPLTVQVPSYTQAQEDSIVSTKAGVSDNMTIWNTTLNAVRIWSGVAFVNAPTMPATSFSPSTMPISTAEQTALNLKAPIASPTFTGTVVIPNQLTFANGSNSGTQASATTGTITVSMVTSIITVTPTGAITFNATGGITGQRCTFVITTSGTSSFVLTFGSNFKSIGTLATGTTTAKTFCVSFVCKDGTTWLETGRTIAF